MAPARSTEWPGHTETWIDRRYRWSLPISALLSGMKDRPSHTQDGIERTLESLAAAAES